MSHSPIMKSGNVYKIKIKDNIVLFTDTLHTVSNVELHIDNKFIALEPSRNLDKILFNGKIYYCYINNDWVEEVIDE